MNELEALVALTAIPHLGSIKIRLLLERFGSALGALDADPTEVADLPGFGVKTTQNWEKWKSDPAWRQNLELAERFHVNVIPFNSTQYPKRLLEIPDFPILLYVRGELQKKDQQCIAVVGTRNASIYGREMAEKISSDLASMGFTVVSGLARGIDAAAHQGALQRGRSIGVIGSGLANIYPREHILLAEEMIKSGALISEFPMATPPDRQNFPQRNRIVSGMTLGTVLIEAPKDSGAMITMNKALSQGGRRLFALPGRVDNDNFEGNHWLIKTGKAQLVESAEDIANSFDSLFSVMHQEVKKRPVLETEEEDFLNLLPKEEQTIDEIAKLTKLPIMKLNVLLMSTVMKQVLKEFPGKIYKKVGY